MKRVLAPRQQHPLSSAFPAMSEDEHAELQSSIATVGVRNPITIFEGMVLDGWHRYCEARRQNVDCPEVELAAGVDPREFVLAQNGARRHMNAGQRALALLRVTEWQPRAAAPAPKPAAKPAPGAGSEPPAPLPAAPRKTEAELAAAAGVSERTLRQAKYVEQHAAPEVIQAVDAGEMSIKHAAEVAHLPPVAQALEVVAPAAKPAKKPKADPTPGAGSDATRITELEAIVARLQAENEQLQAELAAAREHGAELAGQLEEAAADNVAMAKVFDANDQVKAAVGEAKQVREQLRVSEERVRGLMSEKNEAVRSAKGWQRLSEKHERALKQQARAAA